MLIDLKKNIRRFLLSTLNQEIIFVHLESYKDKALYEIVIYYYNSNCNPHRENRWINRRHRQVQAYAAVQSQKAVYAYFTKYEGQRQTFTPGLNFLWPFH